MILSGVYICLFRYFWILGSRIFSQNSLNVSSLPYITTFLAKLRLSSCLGKPCHPSIPEMMMLVSGTTFIICVSFQIFQQLIKLLWVLIGFMHPVLSVL